MTGRVSLRPAEHKDREFLFALHKTSMGAYVEELFGPWDDQVQWEFFDRWFDAGSVSIIVFGDDDVGVLGLEESEDDIYVTRIEVHPDWQDRGIGSTVMRRVLGDAGALGKSVSLHVFDINPARRLYRRLGFVVVEEQDGRLLMRADPGDPDHRRGAGNP